MSLLKKYATFPSCLPSGAYSLHLEFKVLGYLKFVCLMA